MFGFVKKDAENINISPVCCRPAAFPVHCLQFSATAAFSTFIKQIHLMFVRLILCKETANIVFSNAQKVQKSDVKVHLCPDAGIHLEKDMSVPFGHTVARTVCLFEIVCALIMLCAPNQLNEI